MSPGRSRGVQKLIRALKCSQSGLTGARHTQRVPSPLNTRTISQNAEKTTPLSRAEHGLRSGLPPAPRPSGGAPNGATYYSVVSVTQVLPHPRGCVKREESSRGPPEERGRLLAPEGGRSAQCASLLPSLRRETIPQFPPSPLCRHRRREALRYPRLRSRRIPGVDTGR